MPNMSGLSKRRTAARGWVTRAKKALANALAIEGVNRTTLIDAVDEFDKRLATLDEIQSEYELECDDVEAVIEEAADYRESVRKVRVQAAQVLTQVDDSVDASSVHSVQSREAKPEVKLPKLVLPKFSGDVLQWQSFWDQYTAVVHNSELPEVSKFTYLRSLLEGEAKEAIQGLSLTAKHYQDACTILENRFGRRERIIFGHVQELLAMTHTGRQPSLAMLRKLQDSLLSHVRSLHCLGISGEQYGVLLTPIVLSSLPQDIRMEWARSSEGKESDLDWLMEFMDKELKLRETSQTFKSLKSHENNVRQEQRNTKPSVTVLQTVSQGSSAFCNVCGKSHQTSRCWDLVKVSFRERKEKIKKKGLCYRCLGKGHLASACEKSCDKCKGQHHSILCWKGKEAVVEKPPSKSEDVPENAEATVSPTGVCTLTMNQATSVIMQTIKVEVRGRSGKVEANVLFDSGSDRTYVSSDLVRRIDAEYCRSEYVAYCAFGNGKACKEELRNVYSVELRGHSAGSGVISATEVPTVCAPLYRRKVPEHILQSFGMIQLAENYSEDQQVKIDILIGLDQYWKFVKPNISQLTKDAGDLVAQRTVFGWILSGSYRSATVQEGPKMSHQMLCVQCISDVDLQQTWNMDLDVCKEFESPVLQRFTESIELKDGRYEVELPWKHKEKPLELVDNFGLAKQRLRSLTNKLDKDEQLKRRYNEALHEMESNSVIEEVPSDEIHSQNPTFYMPHRPVVKETSSSTKIRPVFDASAQGPNGVSLNDCVETGPNLIPSLVEILLRFRRWSIAIVADIQKAFLQISVKPENRDVHRFLWSDNGAIRIMRLTRVPFGNKSSPFILNATIKNHLKKFEAIRVVSELEENLYVDDWLTGVDEESEATQMIEKASEVMSQCGMNLTKWGSNNKQVLKEVSYNLTDKGEHMSTIKVLGLQWSPEEDAFMFDGISLEPGLTITKRVVLSLIARMFDPLGFMNPFVIFLKCLFQDLWRLGVEWDVEVPLEFGRQVLSWIEDLSLLKEWRVPRSYTGGPWKDVKSIQLESFGDASEKAYGACVYLVAKQGNGFLSSSLVLSKAKVAPVKKVTLPRLELLGAVLAAQLLEFVRKAIRLERVCCRCWSDSTVALSWIKGDPSHWKPFVANRVSQIQQLTSPSQWSHCLGTENPADLLTRGITASKLMESELWLKGPSFLMGTSVQTEHDYALDFSVEESMHETLLSITPSQSQSKLFEVESWGKLTKAIRVVAWVLRFIKNCRVSPPQSGELLLSELEPAKMVLIRAVQRQEFVQEMKDLEQGGFVSRKSKLYKLSPYLDKDGLMRVKGRLDYSKLTFDEKHPIIVPKSHLAVLIIRFQHRLLKHAGVSSMLTSVRNSFWILGARRVAKRIKKQCVFCQKHDSKAAEQPIAPLHKTRVSEAKPFAVVGLDHAGPLYCSDLPGMKHYILLFTCAAVRALHLELVHSLKVADSLLAIRRFIARRGLPSVIWSDNGKTFVAAKQQMIQIYGDLCPQWNFIVPRSPWWGGWWERLVRSVKSALRKSVGLKCLTRTELETVLHEVEACVNSRPLTFVGDDVKDRSPLTPTHFILGRSNVYEKEQLDSHDMTITRADLENRALLRDTLMDGFWSLWSKEYIRCLPSWRGSSKQSTLGQGSIVLIREDGCHRMTWPMGIVVETYSGKDGVIRSCKVRTQKGDFVRSIQRLHHLELESEQKSISSDEINTVQCGDSTTDEESDTALFTNPVEQTVVPKNVRVSKFGRQIKPVKRLDL